MAAVDADVVLVAEGRHREVDPLRTVLGRLGLRPLDRPARVAVLLGELGGLGLPGIGHTPGLQLRPLGLGVALLGRGHHGRVDDLPAHRQEAGGTQGRLVGVEQYRDGRLAHDLGPGECLAEGPDRVGIRNRIGQPEPEEAHEGDPVLD